MNCPLNYNGTGVKQRLRSKANNEFYLGNLRLQQTAPKQSANRSQAFRLNDQPCQNCQIINTRKAKGAL